MGSDPELVEGLTPEMAPAALKVMQAELALRKERKNQARAGGLIAFTPEG